MKRLLFVVWWLVISAAAVAGPHFETPLVASPKPVPVPQSIGINQVLEIGITDMTPELAKLVDLTYYPRPTGIRVRGVADWKANEYRIDFSSPVVGVYLVKLDSPPEQPGGPVMGAEIEITVDVQPGPIPPGPVPPGPTPIPVIQKCQIVVIEETANSTPSFAAIRNSSAVRNWATNGGHTVFFVDKDAIYTGTNGANWKSWIARATGKGTPYVFITPVTDGTTTVYEGPCPVVEGDFIALIQKYGGVGSTCSKTGCPVIQLKGKK